MQTRAAVLAAALVAAAVGAASQHATRANGRSKPTTHPQAPSTTTPSATRSATSTSMQVPVQMPYPQRTLSLFVPQPRSRVAHRRARRPTAGPTHPSATALRPPRAVASTTKPQSAAHVPTVQAHGRLLRRSWCSTTEGHITHTRDTTFTFTSRPQPRDDSCRSHVYMLIPRERITAAIGTAYWG